jgi:transposase-like protein
MKGRTTVMTKDARDKSAREAKKALDPESAKERSRICETIESLRGDLRAFVMNSGYWVFLALLEDERSVLCGPRYAHLEEREAYRHGFDQGKLVLGGRKITVPKPRVRTVDGREVELETWKAVAAEDPLEERVMAQILAGVTTRKYGQSLESAPAGVETSSESRSSVSRRFVARTKKQVQDFLSRPLGDLDLPVIMIDGTGFGDHLLLTALGVDSDGHKHILGVVEGTTESSQVCLSLFRNLIDRGLFVERARLFVIDGGRGVRSAIRSTFNTWALVQRCHVHKMRNILDHLPEHKKPWVRAVVRRAWDAPTEAKAKKQLKQLAKQLEEPHPGAAGSVLEGLEETLTLHRLGIQGALYRTLRSTNPIENIQGTVKSVARNVKQWRSGAMALRWCVTGLVEAEKRFRRVKGFRSMPSLMAALEASLERPQAVDTASEVA